MSQRTDIYACVPQKVDVKIRFQLSERSIYALVGWACGMALGLLLYWAWWPNEFLLTFPPLAGMILALWRGEATIRFRALTSSIGRSHCFQKILRLGADTTRRVPGSSCLASANLGWNRWGNRYCAGLASGFFSGAAVGFGFQNAGSALTQSSET